MLTDPDRSCRSAGYTFALSNKKRKMMEHEIKRLWGTCQMSLMDSKEDCDDALFGICSDLAIKQVEGVNRIPVAVFSARHSENGFAKALTSYCQEHGIDESDIESAPLYVTNAFKSQWFPQFDRKIRAFDRGRKETA